MPLGLGFEAASQGFACTRNLPSPAQAQSVPALVSAVPVAPGWQGKSPGTPVPGTVLASSLLRITGADLPLLTRNSLVCTPRLKSRCGVQAGSLGTRRPWPLPQEQKDAGVTPRPKEEVSHGLRKHGQLQADRR